MFAARPDMFPLTLPPDTPTIDASCTALTAIEEAITSLFNAPVPIRSGLNPPAVNLLKSSPEPANWAFPTAATEIDEATTEEPRVPGWIADAVADEAAT